MLWNHQQKSHYIAVIKRLFAVIFLFYCCFLNAQDNQEKAPLMEVLQNLEKQFPYRFNYSFKTIEEILVSIPPKNLTFTETISYLEKQTAFKFKMLPNNFVSISTKKSYFLCGYIRDSDSGDPIVSATIQGNSTSNISDKNGYFELEFTNLDEAITIRYLGYNTHVTTYKLLKKDRCSNIFLETQLETLPQVVITDYLTEGISKLTDGTFQINLSKIDILPGLIEADVLQTIQALPGIQSINETVSDINIRGGSHDENLLLWDGIKMYQSGHFFGLISVFNPQMTHSVSLKKNGTSVDYSDGVSGTIAMSTNDNINSGIKGSVGINFINAGGFTDVPLGENSSIQIAARKGLRDFVKTPTYSAYSDRILQDTEVNNTSSKNIEFDFYDTSLRWLYKVNRNNVIRLNVLAISNELDFNETAIINSQEVSRKSVLNQNSLAGGLYYKKTWLDNFYTELQVYETDYKLKGTNANILQNQRFLQENKVSETGTKLNSFYKFNDRFTWLNGYQFIETQVVNFEDVDNPVYSLYVAEVLRTHGLYSQLNFSSLNKNTHLNAGLRFNYISKFDKFIPEPRISFNQKILPYLNLEILGEFKHQITSQIINFQDDFLGVEERRWQLSNNNDIPIITSKQISLGLQFHKNGWLINGESYFKKVDGITTQSQGFQNQYLLARTSGSYTVNGFDFLIKKQFYSVNTWLSYSFMDNTYLFKEIQNKEFPNNFNITNAVTLGTSYVLKNFKFSVGLNWHSGKPTTNPVFGNEINDGQINYEPANSDNLDDYIRVDLTSKYQFNLSKNTKAEIAVSLWNLFNHNNTINNYYKITNNNQLDKVSQSSLGFTPNISFWVYF